MHTIEIAQLKLSPNRQRREFDPESLQELVNSIRLRGLLHAPVCRVEDGEVILVAGERRIKAITDLYMMGEQLVYNGQILPTNSIPYVTLGELDELEAEEAELDENIKRDDLTWQEAAAAHQRLDTLRKKQATINGVEHTHADTAEEVFGRRDGHYQSTIRKESIIANHLADPDIAKAKSLDEGFKILKKKETLRKNSALADAVGLSFSAKDHKLFNEDCLVWMKSISDEFDVICTDPLYGMGADKFGDGAGKMTGISHDYDDSYSNWLLIMGGLVEVSAETETLKRVVKKVQTGWCELSYQVCKKEAHAYVFCDPDRFHELKTMMQSAGWYVFRTPFICVKQGSGRVPLPDMGPRRQYELCLYAIKGKKPTTRIYPDVITTLADPNDGHGATKPVALFTNLLQRSVQPGDKVLDSFAGSGPIFGAANLLKCYATGVELSKESYGLSLQRLKRLEEE